MPPLTASGLGGDSASKASVSDIEPATRTAEETTPSTTASEQEPVIGTGRLATIPAARRGRFWISLVSGEYVAKTPWVPAKGQSLFQHMTATILHIALGSV